jgi:hypothetical protein
MREVRGGDKRGTAASFMDKPLDGAKDDRGTDEEMGERSLRTRPG